MSGLATETLLPAAVNPRMDQMEMEDLEYTEDPKRESSNIKADVITLGTRADAVVDEQAKYVSTLDLPEDS